MLLFSMLGAILVAVQVALAGLPNIELVSVLLIVYTCVFGWYAFIPAYIFVALQMVLYGISIWSVSYLYVWAVLILLVIPLRKYRNPFLWAMIAGMFGLVFGALTAIPSFFMGGWSFALAYWINGLFFDLLHCAGNFATTLILYYPASKLLTYGKLKLKI